MFVITENIMKRSVLFHLCLVEVCELCVLIVRRQSPCVMLLVITEIYESSRTSVFPLNLLVVQKYITAVLRIYWCLL
jgi:hypothetical protein